MAAATAVKRTRRGRPPKEPKTPRKRTTDWALNGTLVVAIAIVGAIAFSAFVWSPPEGEIPLPSDDPDVPGIVLGSSDPGGEVLPFDPRVVGVIETSTPPLTQGGITTEGGTGKDAPGGGLLPGRSTATPPPDVTPTPGGSGEPTPDPTTPPTPEPTPARRRPSPRPRRRLPRRRRPRLPRRRPPTPPAAAFEFDPSGLRVKFTNRATNAESWAWSFGDGATSSGRNPSHTYDERRDLFGHAHRDREQWRDGLRDQERHGRRLSDASRVPNAS